MTLMVERTCGGCGGAFVTPRARGRYPSRCDICDPESAAKRAAIREHAGSTPDVETVRLRMLADAARAATVAAAIAPPGAGRFELRVAVTRVARARGCASLRACLLNLAGVCIVWAAQVPGSDDLSTRPK